MSACVRAKRRERNPAGRSGQAERAAQYVRAAARMA